MGKTETEKLKKYREQIKELRTYSKNMERVIDDHRRIIKGLINNAPKAFYLWILKKIKYNYYE